MDMKIIIDTDIGDDIDDAFALAMLSPHLRENLVGVTTVYKNTLERAKLASYLLREFKVKTTICAGESHPLEEPIKFLQFEKPSPDPHITQYDESMKDEPISDIKAPEFIIHAAEKYQKELTILAIGPMTNLAKAYKANPDSFKKIGQILMMGGNISSSSPEWNIKCDPEAMNIVLESGVPIKMVGFDITKRAEVSNEKVDELDKFTSKGLKDLNKLLHFYLDEYSNKRLACMHDPLTASCLLENFVKFKKVKIKVGLDQEKRGVTLVSENGYEVEFAIDADYSTFNKYLFTSLQLLDEQLLS